MLYGGALRSARSVFGGLAGPGPGRNAEPCRPLPPLDQCIGRRLRLLKELKDDERSGPMAAAAIVIFVNLQFVKEVPGAGQVVTRIGVAAPRPIMRLQLGRNALPPHDREHGVPRTVTGTAHYAHDRGAAARHGRVEMATGDRDGGPFAELDDWIEQRAPLLRLGLTLNRHRSPPLALRAHRTITYTA
jgi:hypothetical protein